MRLSWNTNSAAATPTLTQHTDTRNSRATYSSMANRYQHVAAPSRGCLVNRARPLVLQKNASAALTEQSVDSFSSSPSNPNRQPAAPFCGAQHRERFVDGTAGCCFIHWGRTPSGMSNAR